MKQYIITTILLCLVSIVNGQDHETPEILTSDTTWTKEIFHFPLGFAQDIKHQGFEEVRFPLGWAKKESDEFWSYVFVWNIHPQTVINEQELAENLEVYFDGLMSTRIKKEDESNGVNTTALFLKKEEVDSTSTYIGKLKTIDGFFTKKPMILNVLVESFYCGENDKAIVLFRFSPKAFEHDIWQKLGEVNLRKDICDF